VIGCRHSSLADLTTEFFFFLEDVVRNTKRSLVYHCSEEVAVSTLLQLEDQCYRAEMLLRMIIDLENTYLTAVTLRYLHG
jgi:hypothetical protein